MESELIGLFESVKLAADLAANSPGEEDRCLDALKLIKKFPVNYQILVSTQVGKGLRQLTKHKSEKIKSSASALIDIWKTVLQNKTAVENTSQEEMSIQEIVKPIAKTSKLEMGGPPPAPNRYKTAALPNKTEAPKPVKARIFPSHLYCNNTARDKVRVTLAEALTKVSSEVDGDLRAIAERQDPCRVAAAVETALFERWGRVRGPQSKATYRSVIFNLRDPSNRDFRRKVLLGEVGAVAVAGMTAGEMASDERRAQTERLERKSLQNCEVEEAEKGRLSRCGSCRRRETCINCDNRWKLT